jgi:hypothetical protein
MSSETLIIESYMRMQAAIGWVNLAVSVIIILVVFLMNAPISTQVSISVLALIIACLSIAGAVNNTTNAAERLKYDSTISRTIVTDTTTPS